jgi:hypothetical protein
MKLLVFLLLLAGCGKKIIYTNPQAPSNQASTAVKTEIDEELTQIEKEFQAINVNIDLHQMPVVVAPLPFGVVGRCQYGKNQTGLFIVLSPLLFPTSDAYLPLDHELFEKDFVRVLLHEIGHCYFKRQHEKPTFLEDPGHSFELLHDGRAVFFDRIPRSLMPAESPYRLPKALRSYYIAELAKKASLENLTVLGEFTNFQVISNISDAVEPAEE